MTENIIELRNVKKYYEMGEEIVRALDGIDVQIKKGDFIAIVGPSGSGKTFSALLCAFGLTNDWSKIAVIDTENHSADLYSHLGNYSVLNLSKPFSPERYVEAIDVCEKAGMKVIIIDSITQEWDGQGGIRRRQCDPG